MRGTMMLPGGLAEFQVLYHRTCSCGKPWAAAAAVAALAVAAVVACSSQTPQLARSGLL